MTSPVVPESESNPPKPRNRLRTVWHVLRRVILVLVLGGAVVLLGLSLRPQPVPIDTQAIGRGRLRVTIDEEGRTRVKDRYVVSAPLLGNLGRIELKPGDSVTKGSVLARLVPLDPPLLDARTRAEAHARLEQALASEQQAMATISRAKLAAELSQSELSRQQKLLAGDGTVRSAVERAELEHKSRIEEVSSAEFASRVAEHQVELARLGMSRMGHKKPSHSEQIDVRSPITGRVLKLAQSSAGVVSVGTALLELGDPAALEIVIAVLTSDATKIPVGAHVDIERWGGDQALHGRVRRVEPSAFTRISALGVEEQRVNVIVDLVEPPAMWSVLGDGYRVEAKILIHEADHVLLLPAGAVFRRGNEHMTFVVRGGLAKLQRVELGLRGSLEVEVTSGLSDGDSVIVHPSDRVVDGVKVVAR